MIDPELFFPIPGFEDSYCINLNTEALSLPRVIYEHNGTARFHTAKILSPSLNKETGYFYLNLRKDDRSRDLKRSQLMARTFIGCHKLIIDGDRVVDHINRIRTDDRIENLRLVTRVANNNNNGTRKTNASGFLNVSWCKAMKKFRAYGKEEGKQVIYGYFDSQEEAGKVAADRKQEKLSKLLEKSNLTYLSESSLYNKYINYLNENSDVDLAHDSRLKPLNWIGSSFKLAFQNIFADTPFGSYQIFSSLNGVEFYWRPNVGGKNIKEHGKFTSINAAKNYCFSHWLNLLTEKYKILA